MNNDNESQGTQLDIGAVLHHKRSQENQSVADVAAVIKLSKDIIEKLESNSFTDVGSPVYVRGYLGLYAKHLSLDAAYIIDQYNQQYPSETIAIKPSADQAYGGVKKKSTRHSKTLSLVVTAAIIGALVYGYTLVEPMLIKKQPQPAVPVAAENAVSEGAVSSVQIAIQEADMAGSLADNALNGEGVMLAAPQVVTVPATPTLTDTVTTLESVVTMPGAEPASAELAQTNVVSDAVAEQTNGAQTVAAVAQGDGSAHVEHAGHSHSQAESSEAQTDVVTQKTIQPVTATISQPVVVSDVAPADGITTLSLTFDSDCWVQVSNKAGKVLVSRTYGKQKPVTVSGKGPLKLIVGNPGSIASMSLNGKRESLSQYKIKKRVYVLPKK